MICCADRLASPNEAIESKAKILFIVDTKYSVLISQPIQNYAIFRAVLGINRTLTEIKRFRQAFTVGYRSVQFRRNEAEMNKKSPEKNVFLNIHGFFLLWGLINERLYEKFTITADFSNHYPAYWMPAVVWSWIYHSHAFRFVSAVFIQPD